MDILYALVLLHLLTAPAFAQNLAPSRDRFPCVYRVGGFSECSATCNGGMQYRSVECFVQDPSNPRPVDESRCITQRQQRPPSEQACNTQTCTAEFTASSFSECSVTCGEGQQTREVTCIGASGQRLSDESCRGQARPASVRACRKPACQVQISWHVTAYGQCSRSCNSGVRERRVGCFDTDLNPYPEDRCGSATKPTSMESCNLQPCRWAQTVPSVQKPGASGSSITMFVPYVPGQTTVSQPDPNSVHSPRCAQSTYGCCPDGQTPATGPGNRGCLPHDCIRSRYGCCLDGVTPALGLGRVGCPSYPSKGPDSNAVGPVTPPRQTYIYRTGAFTDCSATCNGGVQYRAVGCFAQNSRDNRAVAESFCIAQRLQRPPSEQACNTQPCTGEYSVSSFGMCSVTCGEGQQTREVTCIGASGQRLSDEACRGQARPASVRACQKPACQVQILWHVTPFGMCSKSCGSGIRERRVACFDTNLNPYPEDRCGLASKPSSVESCNIQPCNRPQMVPSVQIPGSSGSAVISFVLHVPRETTAPKGQNVYPPVVGPRCAQSPYGCCPDGQTSAAGPGNSGCPQSDCTRSRFGCCLDGVTPASGAGRAGCPTTDQVDSSSRDVCFMPRDQGPCDAWTVRFSYDSRSGKCTEFWFGSCQGNGNNFKSVDACRRMCGAA